MSCLGKKMKRDGPTASIYMTHAKFCKRSRVRLPILECTPDLDMGMVEECHGPEYEWHQLFLGPGDCGHAAVSRPRTYVIGCRTQDCQAIHDVAELADRITEQLRWTETVVSDYLLATPTEVALEAHALARKRQVHYEQTDDLHYLLSENEKKRLA
ncbi:unnamed protein product, partial [Symbiodinium necroappetens]